MQYQRIVVKLGTSVLTSGGSSLDRAHMVELVRQMAFLHKQGCEIVLCTSGAIAAGRERLGFPALSDSMSTKQMLAAVGQSQLIQTWENLFNIYGLHVGQMLLTRADLDDRERYLNARDMLETLLKHKIIPIINENDAVATTEIKVGDNDNLSALMVGLADADLLMLLTDQAGLYDANPRTNPQAKLIAKVDVIDDELKAMAGDSGTSLGTGGMATKLQAAEIARRSGSDVVIAAGHHDNVIIQVSQKQAIGTWFSAMSNPLESRKRWLLAGPGPVGTICLDDGAVNAVLSKGSSLLAKGVSAVQGEFHRGDMVVLTNPQGGEVARGLARYSSDDLLKIKGLHSQEIETVLGYGYGKVVVHRNNLVVR
ncbi:glutamate 5-kinase [Psychrobium sp. 1_MG-2023]|uniref:glutamate 5-kinase n=1 Tax=Psychrobium sp. 1_MG-2023 TaxID=3062624 RepID=UPI000C33F76E|nr:glutamate 5-kinase [Psychrobium sp. 1_MG-2023]MDP2561346.1 glutamate 5-kinase [Psychrobium sp. 1_MG-2023]PKF54179.1 glutamate 5-kinase [Alteromonadales bacterium alter-6D02]